MFIVVIIILVVGVAWIIAPYTSGNDKDDNNYRDYDRDHHKNRHKNAHKDDHHRWGDIDNSSLYETEEDFNHDAEEHDVDESGYCPDCDENKDDIDDNE